MPTAIGNEITFSATPVTYMDITGPTEVIKDLQEFVRKNSIVPIGGRILILDDRDNKKENVRHLVGHVSPSGSEKIKKYLEQLGGKLVAYSAE